MLYSTGPVQIFVGYITTVVGLVSSKKIADRYATTTAAPAAPTGVLYTAPDRDPPTTPSSSAFFSALGNGDSRKTGVELFLDGQRQSAIDAFGPQAAGLFDITIPDSARTTPVTDKKRGNEPPSTSKPAFLQSATVMWLGTCERVPAIKFRRQFRPIYHTSAGRQVAYDKAYCGRDAVISTTFTNWNESVYERIAARMNARSQNGAHRGVDTFDSIGSLLLTEGLAYILFLQYPNSGKQQMANGGMPPGYRFYAAYPLDEGPSPGTVTNRLSLTWHALKVTDFFTGDTWLFDHDLSLTYSLPTPYGA